MTCVAAVLDKREGVILHGRCMGIAIMADLWACGRMTLAQAPDIPLCRTCQILRGVWPPGGHKGQGQRASAQPPPAQLVQPWRRTWMTAAAASSVVPVGTEMIGRDMTCRGQAAECEWRGKWGQIRGTGAAHKPLEPDACDSMLLAAGLSPLQP